MLDAMQAHTGKQPIIYTDPVFYRDVLDGEFTNYHYWLRSVAAEPDDEISKRARGPSGSSPPRALFPGLRAGSTATASTAPSATGIAC